MNKDNQPVIEEDLDSFERLLRNMDCWFDKVLEGQEKILEKIRGIHEDQVSWRKNYERRFLKKAS